MTDQERYEAACHAMQSAVAFEIGQDAANETTNSGATPKYLRVGVNSALVETSMLAQLLMDKGIITKQEYAKALADAMEAEVARYHARYPGIRFA